MSAAPRTGPNRPLTNKQRAFAHNILAGMTGAAAYRDAYKSTMSPRVLTVEAKRTVTLPHVAAFIERERAKQDQAALMTRLEKRRILSDLARSKSTRPSERIKAIEVDNVMTGDNAPQKVEVFGLAELMKLVRSGGSA